MDKPSAEGAGLIVKKALPREDEFEEMAVHVFGAEMAKAIDGGWLIAGSATPKAVLVKLADINGRPRRLTVTVEMANVETTP